MLSDDVSEKGYTLLCVATPTMDCKLDIITEVRTLTDGGVGTAALSELRCGLGYMQGCYLTWGTLWSKGGGAHHHGMKCNIAPAACCLAVG